MMPGQATTSCSHVPPATPDGLPWPFENRWLSEDALRLAAGIVADQAFDRVPILADALEEAGCDDPVVLNHCRGCAEHQPGCWVVRYVIEGDPFAHEERLSEWGRLMGNGRSTPPVEDWSEYEPRPVPAVLKWIQRGFWALIILFLLNLCLMAIAHAIRNA